MDINTDNHDEEEKTEYDLELVTFFTLPLPCQPGTPGSGSDECDITGDPDGPEKA